MTARRAEGLPEDVVRALLRRWLTDRAVSFSRAPSGGSTAVYRVDDADSSEVYFLRLAEEAGESRAAEARVHELLHAAGVPVPDVVVFEALPPELDRSAMLTRRIPGRALWEHEPARLDGAATEVAAWAAGRDLARINRIPVRGFGWVEAVAEDGTLLAEHPTRAAWTVEYQRAVAEVAGSGLLAPGVVAHVQTVIERWRRLPDRASSHLAHGDFDASHIFLNEPSLTYSGLIDFGEIRGADRLYDLGHALLHDTEPDRPPIFTPLLAGYREISPLPSTTLAEIRDQAVAIGTRQLAIFHGRNSPATGRLAGRLTSLLTGHKPALLVDSDAERRGASPTG